MQGDQNGWQLTGSVEGKRRPGMPQEREESALNMFRQMDLKGKVKDDTQLQTVHQNTISTARTFQENGGRVSKFSSKSFGSAYISNMPGLITKQPAALTGELWCGTCELFRMSLAMTDSAIDFKEIVIMKSERPNDTSNTISNS